MFAYVLRGYFIIPVGEFFKGRSFPSSSSCLSDLRAYIATWCDMSAYPVDPVVAATIVEAPSSANIEFLAPAILDSFNPPMLLWEQANFSNDMFVDDNGVGARAHRAFEICTRRMIVAWPRSKRLALQSELTTLLSAHRRPMCTSRMAASLFCKIRSASQNGGLRLLYRRPPCCPPRQL
jgi:hypothetical protein